MTENRSKPGSGLAEGLNAVGLEMIKGKDKLFRRGDQIYILGPKLIPVTIMSEHGLTGHRLKRKKGSEGRTHLVVRGEKVELPDLEVKIDGLSRYVLIDQEAFIDNNNSGTGGNNRITQGFLFWAY